MPILPSGSTGVVPRLPFTKRAIEALSPRPQRYYVWDSVVRGLSLVVQPSGKKSFYLYRKINGRPERILIGSFPDLRPERARALAESMNGVIAEGGNPAKERRQIQSEMTLQELFETFKTLWGQERLRMWKVEERRFNKYLHKWKLRRLSSITRQDVLALHAQIGRDHGPYIANRIVSLISSMWNRAISDWGLDAKNPAEKIRFFRESARERFLDGAELKRLFEALELEPNQLLADFFRLLLFTGARSGNVSSMRWDEINFHRQEWSIPATKSKSGETMTLPLVPAAFDILVRRRASALNDFVFPAQSRSGHITGYKAGWARIIKRAELADVRMHDCRRTLGSLQCALGTSLPIIGKSLGHTSVAATAIYSRLNLDPVRESVSNAVAAMLAVKAVD